MVCSILRAKAQHHGDEVVDSVRTESSNESILIKGARKGIWLSVRLRQLSEKIKSEIDRSQKLLHEVSTCFCIRSRKY